jgi:hypothetical protein
VPLEDLLSRAGEARARAQSTIDALAACRQRVDERERRLESPQAARELVDFFAGFFAEAVAILDRVIAELAEAAQPAHVEALRQIASNAAAEQRRNLKFRDKWINRPLPYEDVRPLLNELSNAVRDGLAAGRDLHALADDLAALLPPPGPATPDGRPLDRRALFTKWFGR